MKVARGVINQLGHLGIAEIGWCATTPMHLQNRPLAVNPLRLHGDFAQQALQVLIRPPGVSSHNPIAGAVVADMLAKRDMHIQGQGAAGLIAVLQRLPVIIRCDFFMKLQCSRIGSVARSLFAVATNKISIPVGHCGHPQHQWRQYVAHVGAHVDAYQ